MGASSGLAMAQLQAAWCLGSRPDLLKDICQHTENLILQLEVCDVNLGFR
jgi:hypothetical protein